MSPPVSPARTRTPGLPWFPLLVLGAAGLAWAYLATRPELERNFASWLISASWLLTGVLLLLWFLLSRRFSVMTRLRGFLGVLALAGLAYLTLRVDGTTDGTGLPRLVWRWSGGARTLATLAAPASAPGRVPTADPRLAGVDDVPQFFGTDRAGRVPGGSLSPDWSNTPPRQVWRQPIGAGWSAFAVVRDRAFTQEQRGEEELVTCYDLFTGRLLWSQADRARFFQWQGGEGPRATPTVQEGRVYAYGATGLLNCLDAASGRRLWQRGVLAENQLSNLEWGVSASPLVVDDLVVVTGGRPRGPVLFAYRRLSGELAWKAGDDQASYASPILATVAGRRVILSHNARALSAHDPKTGAVLGEHAWGAEKWPKASQPVVVEGDRIFLSAGYGMGCLLLHAKAGHDGRLELTQVWKGIRMKTQFNSAALRDGFLYGLDDGRLACVDVRTGERRWKEGNYASGQTLLVGDLILVQSERGPVHLCAARPEGFLEFGRLAALEGKTWNHPVVAGRYLLVRHDREAACFELPAKR